MSKEVMYKNLIAFHPGSYVEDIIDELNITQAEFAERLGTSSKTVSKIVNGEEDISRETANKLAKLTGISIITWLNLQSAYDAKVMEIKNMQDNDEREICRLIDFRYFKKHGFLREGRYTVQDKISSLRKLLNVSSLSKLYEFNAAVSYRNTLEFKEKSIVNSNIMLELAMNAARTATDKKYKKKDLEKALPIIRTMTLEDPEVFYPKLKQILLDCGIVLIGLPKLTGANLNGATKKFKNGSVLLLITDRNKSSDIFWFSLVHELGHIFYDDFYSDYENKDEYSSRESKADQFALNFFIPHKKYSEFINNRNFSEKSILSFSEEMKLHPSILVGRLKNDRYLEYHEFNHLKDSYSVIISQ